MCSFCDDNTLDGLGMTLTINNSLNNKDKLILDLWGDVLEMSLYSKQSDKNKEDEERFSGVLRICFCPMCGKRLSNNK